MEGQSPVPGIANVQVHTSHQWSRYHTSPDSEGLDGPKVLHIRPAVSCVVLWPTQNPGRFGSVTHGTEGW